MLSTAAPIPSLLSPDDIDDRRAFLLCSSTERKQLESQVCVCVGWWGGGEEDLPPSLFHSLLPPATVVLYYYSKILSRCLSE